MQPPDHAIQNQPWRLPQGRRESPAEPALSLPKGTAEPSPARNCRGGPPFSCSASRDRAHAKGRENAAVWSWCPTLSPSLAHASERLLRAEGWENGWPAGKLLPGRRGLCDTNAFHSDREVIAKKHHSGNSLQSKHEII